MGRLERIAKLEARYAELEENIATSVAELTGIRSELDALRSGAAPDTDLTRLPVTDAIVSVLRQAGGAMTPNDIHQRLTDGGVTISINATNSTLSYLMKQQRVLRPSRGQYVAL